MGGNRGYGRLWAVQGGSAGYCGVLWATAVYPAVYCRYGFQCKLILLARNSEPLHASKFNCAQFRNHCA